MRRALNAVALTTALGVLVMLTPGAAWAHASRPGPMRWTAPALVDHNGTSGHSVQALACPSTSLCVAADDTGSILTNTDPFGDATWQLNRVDDAGGLSGAQEDSINALVCPSVHLCLGVDGYGGGLLSTTHPTSGTAAWHRVQLPDHEQFSAAACPSASLCFAADFAGGIWVSTHPTGPAKDWRRTMLPVTGSELSSLACPSATLCLAAGREGYVFVSTDPARGGATFRRVLADPDPGAKFAPNLDDVACSSSHWCVAVDSGGGVVTTSDPAGPGSGWTRTELDPGSSAGFSAGLAAVTCRTSGLCVTVDPTGNVWASDAAAATFSQVATAPADGSGGYGSIQCPSSSECLAVAAGGDELRTSAPTSAGSWSALAIPADAGDALADVSCPSTSLCVAIDGAGNAFTSTDPARSSSWQAVDIDATTPLEAVSCPTTTFCAVADATGDVVTSQDPTGGASAWHSEQVVGPVDFGGGPNPVSLGGIACASAGLCLTGDEDPGQIFTTTDPTGPASAWNADTGIGYRYGLDGLDGVSCSSPRLCVTISGNEIHASAAPTGDRATQVTVSDNLDAVSCASRTFCAAARGRNSGTPDGGGVWASTDPAGATPRWRQVARDSTEQLGISCHATGLCVAVDSGGRALIAFGPTSPGARWTSHDVDGLAPLTSVSCPTSQECVAVDAFGRVLVGRRMAVAPAASAAPTASAASAASAASRDAAATAPTRTVTVVNRTRETIWPAAWPGSVHGRTGWRLPAGRSLTITVPGDWNARLWGRTGCRFDGAGRGRCVTGGCGAVYQCRGWGAIPSTLAEYDLDAYDHLDFYDVSMVDGSNLPMYITTVHGTTPDRISPDGCERGHGCTTTVRCPSALRVRHRGQTVACISPCARFHTDRYCCAGRFAHGCSPARTWPIDYARVFKRAEPFAYSWSGDDATSVFTCAGGCGYEITFGVTPPAVGGPPG
jgi:hypothetical protein